MRQVFKKQKPTEATYFQSESQRKHTSRLSFIYGSKQLVAVLSILVVGSAITGIAIVQKQRSSSAATQPVSFNSSIPGEYTKWTPSSTSSEVIFDQGSNPQEKLKILYAKGKQRGTAAESCFSYNVPGDVRATAANMNIASNAWLTTEVQVKFVDASGQSTTLFSSNQFNAEGGGSDLPKTQVLGLPISTGANGGTVKYCHNTLPFTPGTFSTPRYSIVMDFNITGTREVADAPAAPAPTCQTGKVENSTEAEGQETKLGNATETASRKGVIIADSAASECRAFKMSNTEHFSRTVLRSGEAGDYAVQVRAKGGAVKVTLAISGRNNNQGVVKTVTFPANEFKTENITAAFNGAPQNIVGNVIKDLPANSNVIVRLETTGTATADWLKLQKTGTPSTPTGGDTAPVDDTPGTGAVTTPSCSVAARPMEKNPVGAADLNPVGTPKPEKINDGGTEAYVLKEKDQGVDCYIKLPQGSQPGAYVLGFSAKGKKDTLVDLVMVSGESDGQQLQRSTKKFTEDYTYSTDVPQLARMPINYGASGSNASEKTIRIMNPGDVVRARFILKSGSVNVANLQLYRDPCSDNAGNDIRPTTEDPTCKLAIKESFEQAQERKAIQDAENGNSPKPDTDDAPASNEGQAPSPAPAAPAACEAASGATSKRAIEAVRSSEGTVAVPDNGEGNVVALITNKGTLECTFTVPADKDGDHFAARAKVRGDEVLGKRPQATISLSTADKKVSQEQINSPKGNAWGKVGFNQKDKFTVLKAGDKVTVKVQFTNDTSNSKGLDRNLFVSDIYLESVGKRTDSSPVPTTSPAGLDTETACKSIGASKEAENALASGKVELANNVGEASNGKAAKILDITGKVECTLKATEAGRYSISARIKGSADSKVVLAGKTDGQEEQNREIVLGESTWENFDTVQNSDPDLVYSLDAGQEITVSISSTNARSGFIGNKHVFVDYFRIVKVAEVGTTGLPAATLPPTRGSAQIVQTVTGQTANYPNLFVEAISNDTVVSEGIRKNPDTSREVTLDRDDASIEYTFTVTTEDVYGIGFVGRGQSFEGKLSEAEIRIKSEKNSNFQNIRKYDTYQIRDDQNRLYTASEKQRLEPGKYTVRVQLKNYDSDETSTRSVTVRTLNLVGSTSDRKTIAAENGQKCTYRGISDSIACHELLVQDPKASGDQSISLRRKHDIVNVRVKIDSPGEYNFNIHLRSQSPDATSAKAEVKIDGNKKTGSGIPVSKTEYERLSYTHSFTNTEPKWYNIEIKYLNDQCGENAKDCDINSQTNDRDLLVDYIQYNKALEPAGGGGTPVLNVLSPTERVLATSSIITLPKRANG